MVCHTQLHLFCNVKLGSMHPSPLEAGDSPLPCAVSLQSSQSSPPGKPYSFAKGHYREIAKLVPLDLAYVFLRHVIYFLFWSLPLYSNRNLDPVTLKLSFCLPPFLGGLFPLFPSPIFFFLYCAHLLGLGGWSWTNCRSC